MAVNVDIVYKTVLSILNKEQRGYMTPQEFNKTATQVQLEIFEQYFDDLNQQLRVNQSDYEYADRVANIDEKMSIFKTTGICNYVTNSVGGYFTLPTTDIYGTPTLLYRLGTLDYKNRFGVTIGPLEELQKYEFYYIQNSRLTTSTEKNPTFFRESNRVVVAPSTIGSQTLTDGSTKIIANYIRKPLDPVWGFTVGSRGQYIYNPAPFVLGNPSTGSRDFELHESEQTRLIIKILMYAGIIIKDPQIVQAAAQQSQLEDINSKS